MSSTARKKISVLFLCTGNSCRSQMVEGWVRHLKADAIDAHFAVLAKHGLNPLTVKAMAEAGVDMSRQQSRLVSDLPDDRFDFVITLLWASFSGKILHRGFDDPPRLAVGARSEEGKLVFYRRVRDEIRDFINHCQHRLAMG